MKCCTCMMLRSIFTSCHDVKSCNSWEATQVLVAFNNVSVTCAGWMKGRQLSDPSGDLPKSLSGAPASCPFGKVNIMSVLSNSVT